MVGLLGLVFVILYILRGEDKLSEKSTSGVGRFASRKKIPCGKYPENLEPLFTLEDVVVHNDVHKSLWLSIHGYVLDVTPFGKDNENTSMIFFFFEKGKK